jgi:hypothetical protein
MRYAVLCIICLVLTVGGCAYSKSVRYETITRAEKPENYPIELIERKDIKREYKVIGLAQVNAGKLASTADVMEKLREQARKMGGEALTELEQQPIGGGSAYKGTGSYSGHVRDLWSAKIVVWEDSE